MKLLVKKGTTSKIVLVFIQDGSATDGSGLTGVAFGDVTGFYYREGQGTGATAITMATMTIGTWATGGFVEVDSADMPGWYELSLPNAVLASGVDYVGVQLKGATNMAPLNIEIQLTDLDVNVAMRGTDGVDTATMRGTDGANTTTPLSAAAVNAEVDTALADYDPPTRTEATADKDAITALLGTPTDFGSGTSTIAANLQDLADDGTEVYSRATDSLQAVRDRGDAAWTTGAGGSDRLLMVDTTIATLASQTSFTLTAGSADDDAYNNCTIIVEDVATATQKAVAVVSGYVGSTKTITLKYDPAIFTMAATDKIYILAENALKATLANRQLNVAADGDIAGNVDGNVVGSVASVTAEVSANVTKISGDATAADNLETVFDGVEGLSLAYYGPRGPGVYFDDTAGNTNTVNGVDGTRSNPVSTEAAAKTIADSLGCDRIYIVNDSTLTLAQSFGDISYEFIGIGQRGNNTLALGGQNVDQAYIENLLVSGAKGGNGLMTCVECSLSSITAMHGLFIRCGIVFTLTIATRSVFEGCYSMAASDNDAVIIDLNSVAALDVTFRNWSGNLQFNNGVSTQTIDVDGIGLVDINSTCTSLVIKISGNMTVTDGGTTTVLTVDAAVNRTNINAECDTAISDAALATAASIAALNDLAASDVLTTALTEAYAADGVAPTLSQLLFMIWSVNHEFSISGTTISSKKLDSTEAMTHTLDDATNPTSRERAT